MSDELVTMGAHSYVSGGIGGIKTLIPVTVGRYCSIAGMTTIAGQHPPVDHPEAVASFPLFGQLQADYWDCRLTGHVRLGNDVWVGSESVFMDNVTVGDGAIVAARSVVARDVPPYAIVAGNTATVKRLRFAPEQIEALLRIRWWDWTEDEIRAAAPHMKDVTDFLAHYDRA